MDSHTIDALATDRIRGPDPPWALKLDGMSVGPALQIGRTLKYVALTGNVESAVRTTFVADVIVMQPQVLHVRSAVLPSAFITRKTSCASS